MTIKAKAEIFLAMNEDGDYEVACNADDARQYLTENVGGDLCRIVKLTAFMMPPFIAEHEVDIPDSAGTTTHIEAEAAE